MAGRCERHGLAAGPDGACVVCRREAVQVASVAPRAPKRRSRAWLVVLLLVLVVGGAAVVVGRSSLGPQRRFADKAPGDRDTVSFAKAHPAAAPAEVSRRTGLRTSGDVDLGRETFETYVPTSYERGKPHGLLVWIDSGSSGEITSPDWFDVLESVQVIWIGPNGAGNGRPADARVTLALDAVQGAFDRFDIDRRRVYVGGFSGGAKSALRALLGYPDVFRGGVFCAGAEYFRDVPAADSRFFPARYSRPPDLDAARQTHIALVSGPRDPNFAQINAVLGGMRSDRFGHAELFSEPELGHVNPSGKTLARVLSWLDRG